MPDRQHRTEECGVQLFAYIIDLSARDGYKLHSWHPHCKTFKCADGSTVNETMIVALFEKENAPCPSM